MHDGFCYKQVDQTCNPQCHSSVPKFQPKGWDNIVVVEMPGKTGKILTLICLLVSFLLLSYTRTIGFRSTFLEQCAQTIVYPVVYLTGTLSKYTQQIVYRRESYSSLSKKYDRLHANHIELQEKFAKLSASSHHFKKTKDLIKFQERYKLTSATIAHIVTKQFSDNGHYFVVNRGSRHSVTKDMIAIYKLQIVGRVVSVSPFYSKIMLITDKFCRIASFTNATSAHGILAGSNTINQCNLSCVSHLSFIENNDLVFSSGKGTVFPEGFCVGKITQHSLVKKELYHTITVEPLVDLTRIEFCMLTSQAKLAL